MTAGVVARIVTHGPYRPPAKDGFDTGQVLAELTAEGCHPRGRSPNQDMNVGSLSWRNVAEKDSGRQANSNSGTVPHVSGKSTKRTKKRRRPAPSVALGRAGASRASSKPSSKAAEPERLVPASAVAANPSLLALGGLAAAALLYAYWPTWVWIEQAWRNEPDYSHGYLVPPLALFLCWSRTDIFPGIRSRLSWGGLSLIGVGIVMRIASRFVYADFLDAWSMLPMIAGAVWLLVGSAAMRWALPAIAFLFLMFPLPFQAESMLSWKLQGVATELSTIFLRVLGQPAVSEAHVIWIGEEQLFVEEACSGLRIFVGVAALAFFWAAITRRAWIDRVVLLAATLPLAIVVNAVRITTVGLIYRWTDAAGSRQVVHDVSGYLMIPIAFGLLYLVKLYWQQLYRPLEQLTAKDYVRVPATNP